MTDSELLRAFVHDRNEPAFAALVRRYQDIVYSASLRRTGHPQHAEDAAQQAFVRLVMKAAALVSQRALARRAKPRRRKSPRLSRLPRPLRSSGARPRLLPIRWSRRSRRCSPRRRGN